MLGWLLIIIGELLQATLNLDFSQKLGTSLRIEKFTFRNHFYCYNFMGLLLHSFIYFLTYKKRLNTQELPFPSFSIISKSYGFNSGTSIFLNLNSLETLQTKTYDYYSQRKNLPPRTSTKFLNFFYPRVMKKYRQLDLENSHQLDKQLSSLERKSQISDNLYFFQLTVWTFNSFKLLFLTKFT